MALVTGAIPIALILVAVAGGCGDDAASEGTAPTCLDGVRNGDEGGVDCGGSCTACVSDAGCRDGVKGGLETDIDCGGAVCSPCAEGRNCQTHADCLTSLCDVDTCTNNILGLDGCETDADCGDGFCEGNLCQPPSLTCSDGVQNGLETDVDCGGETCSRCHEEDRCLSDRDCLNSRCEFSTGSATSGTCAVAQILGLDDCDRDDECGAGFCEEGWCQPPRASALAAGDRHACALVQKGQVRCWGDASDSQTGRRIDGSPLSLVWMGVAEGDVPRPLEGMTNIAAGPRHTCAFNSQSVYCWGNYGYDGPSGAGGVGPDAVEISMFGVLPSGGEAAWSALSGVQAMALGERHTCVLMRDGVRCWGENDAGQLGVDSRGRFSPIVEDVVPLGFTASRLTAGNTHTCAAGGSGVVCWGDNGSGQVSGIATMETLGPTSAFEGNPLELQAQGQTSCAAVTGQTMPGTQIGTGVAWCWGVLPFEPAAGVGAGPVRLQGVLGFALMAVGERFLCLLTARGVECIGEVGTAMMLVPAEARTVVGAGGRLDVGDPVSAIIAGRDFACSLAQEGEVRCWGDNGVGQLADKTEEGQSRAVAKPWSP